MAELGETDDPTALIPGNPAAIDENARVLEIRAQAATTAGDGLGKIDTGSWTGQAEQHFHDKFSYEPAKWLSAGDSLDAASEALTGYATTLRWAQSQAGDAIRLWNQGQAATQTAKAQYNEVVMSANTQNQTNAGIGNPARIQVPPFSDPGEPTRQAARDTLTRARQQLTEAGDRAAESISEEAGGAPKDSSWLDDVGGFLSDLGEGAWGAIRGFGEGVWSLVEAVGDPGNPDHPGLTDIAAAAWNDVTHPVDFAKRVVDWDDWSDHPGRAIGQIAGGLVLAGGTGKVLKELGGVGKGDKGGTKPADTPLVKACLPDYFTNGAVPTASDLRQYAEANGWTKQQTATGPAKYVDDNGIVRMTLKEGSGRTPGSETPHVELRNESGERVDSQGNPVTRKSPGNHTPITWDK
jgi:hypothetical protein